MRLLFLSPSGGLGGAERALGDLLAGIASAAPEVRMHLVAFGDGPLLERARAAHATVTLLEAPPVIRAFGDSRFLGASRLGLALRGGRAAVVAAPAILRLREQILREVRAFDPDVVHSNGVKTHVLSALLGVRAPLAWHLRDFVGARPLAARLLRALSASATVGLAISRAVMLDAGRALPRLKTRMLADATDIEAFRPGPGEPELLDRLAAPALPAPAKNAVRVGLVATFARWKGHDVFLQAAAAAARTWPDIPLRFYVVGGPIYATAGSQFSREELFGMARELGVQDRVAFVPFQSEPAFVYRSLDIVVHASTRPEPFGLAITEAMACARAVVVSGAGGAAEIVTPGRDGLVHPMGDADALARAITTLAGDARLRRALGEEARKKVVAKFSRERLVAEALELFEGLARGRDL